ncbi:MAG: 2-dehydropantoate 2-reductase [Marinobacter sp.]|nr:2-dehydropantoate 2-reductase [Marinobacter sp.]
MSEQPPVLIVGAGALGKLWAARLSGSNPQFLYRPQHSAGMTRYQRLDLAGHSHHHAIPGSPTLELGCPPTAVLVTTKAMDARSALEPLINVLPPTVPVVLFQNGMGSQQAIASRWPDHPILAASTTEGANCPDRNTLVQAGRGETWLGGLTEAGKAIAASMAARLHTDDSPVHHAPDILYRLWQKLAVNAGINPYTAILACRNGDILQAPLFQGTIQPLCQEVSALMTAEGYPGDPTELEARIRQVATATANNLSSMRQDVMAERATEIDFINGFIVTQSIHHGLPVPVNQMLVAQVKQLTHQ